MRIVIRSRKDFPKCLRPLKEIKGICIGECICFPGRRLKDVGHAHCAQHSPPGWICLRRKHLLKCKGILLHEAAHIIVSNTHNRDHGKEWKRVVVAIGGSFKSFNTDHGRTTIDYTRLW